MAIEQLIYDMSLQAAADFYTTSAQYLVMKLDTNGRAAKAGAANAASIGVLQNKPKQYEAAEVRRVGISKVRCGDTIACAGYVTGDSDSKAVTAAAGERYVGIALEAGIEDRVISILNETGFVPAA